MPFLQTSHEPVEVFQVGSEDWAIGDCCKFRQLKVPESQVGSCTLSMSHFSFLLMPAHWRARDENILFDNGHLSPASNKWVKVYGTELSHKFAIPNDALHAFVNVCFT